MNPDQAGNRMIETRVVSGTTYRMTTTCADSTIGDCGERTPQGGLSGRCVCSTIQPKPDVPAGQRVLLCPGQRDDGALNPKCFGAVQPRQQTCDADRPHDEDCDGRTDAPDGKNLAEFGQKCGVSVGRCRAGTVGGCDRKKLNAFSADPTVRPASAQGPVPGFSETSRFLVCDAAARGPVNEQCNGFDDDCDGLLPGADPQRPVPDAVAEIDLDGDKYLRCTGCQDVYDGTLFNGSYRACGDCDDRPGIGASFYPPVPGKNAGDPPLPGATEICDGLSNQCLPAAQFEPVRDDGREQCGRDMYAAAATCCPLIPMCIDTQTSFDHCGGCAMRCTSAIASRCGAGQCKCKDDPACDPASADKAMCNANIGCVQCLSAANCKDAGRPVCHSKTGRCVECEQRTECGSGKPACDTATSRCVSCLDNTDCPLMKPTCSKDAGGDATKNVCISCLVAMDCGANRLCITNVTDPTQNRCSECLVSNDCKDASKPVCQVDAGGDVTKNRCIACKAAADCKDATKPVCAVDAGGDATKNQCIACKVATDCKVATKPFCLVDSGGDLSKNQCVACRNDMDCMTGKTCDSLTKTCK